MVAKCRHTYLNKPKSFPWNVTQKYHGINGWGYKDELINAWSLINDNWEILNKVSSNIKEKIVKDSTENE